MTARWVLGISASHNGAYCLLEGDRIRVAIQEERLTGLKRARVRGATPALALRYCLDTAGIAVDDLSLVVISSQGAATDAANDLRLNPDLRGATKVPVKVVAHHLAHAASAFATSGFTDAAVLVVDGLGSPLADCDDVPVGGAVGPVDGAWEHLSMFTARGTCVRRIETHTVADGRWLHKRADGMWDFFSLGGMFTAAAQQIFGDETAAGKVMGLAAYGDPHAIPRSELVTFVDGRLRFPNRVQARFRSTERWPQNESAYADLAAAAQRALESTLVAIAQRLRARTGARSLCYAGGVALNSMANERILRECGFDDVYVIPAAEDCGVAVGAAYLGLWDLGPHRPIRLRTDAAGRTHGASEIDEALSSTPGVQVTAPADLVGAVVEELAAGRIGAWFQGGSELGPRALGQRSIVASPIGPDVKRDVNGRVKFREMFRPFAPAVLREHAEDWFDFDGTSADSPFMLRVVPFRPAVMARVPAVVHADGTGRLQTLTREANELFYDLVARFGAATGVPILLNTSLNVRGEPIAERPEDALWCLLGTGLDFCVLHDRVVTRAPDAPGIMEMVPEVVASGCLVPFVPRDGSLHLSATAEPGAVVRTATPWGEAQVPLPGRLFALLIAIDGRQNVAALQRSLGAAAVDVVCDLLVLRRMGAIAIRSPEGRAPGD